MKIGVNHNCTKTSQPFEKAIPYYKSFKYQQKNNPTTQLKIKKNIIVLANRAGISKMVLEYYALKMQKVDGVFKKSSFENYLMDAYTLINGKRPCKRTSDSRKAALLKSGLIIDRKHCYTLVSYSQFEEIIQNIIYSKIGESKENTLKKRWMKIESGDTFIDQYEALILNESRDNKSILKRMKEKESLLDKLKSVAHTNLTTRGGISLLAESLCHLNSERFMSQKAIAVILGKKSRHTGRAIVQRNPNLNFVAGKQRITRIEANEVFKPEIINALQDEKSWYMVKDAFIQVFKNHFKVKSFNLPITYNSDTCCFYVYHPLELVINGK